MGRNAATFGRSLGSGGSSTIYSVYGDIITICAMPRLSPLGNRYANRPRIAWRLCALMVVAFGRG